MQVSVKDMCKQQSGRWHIMREDTLVMVLQHFTQSMKKSVRQCASEI
jgi:hypothetical protein